MIYTIWYQEGDISIHALVKRATAQLTRIEKRLIISIHALVKRATFETTVFDGQTFTISIHALVKRATWRRGVYNVGNFDFNPRPREEGDGRDSV